MPFFGLGLHVLVALFFAIHAVRSGQSMYWLFILFAFPLLGSIVYFVVIFLPASRIERGARKIVASAAKAIDPTRELREAQSAFEYTPTAANQSRLAAALLEADRPEEAAANYEACLKGPFASDPLIRFGAARAFVECRRYAQALSHLDAIRAGGPDFRPEQVALLRARALAGDGRVADARTEFDAALARFGSFEVRAEYAIWAVSSGDTATASRLKADLDQTMKRWDRHTRDHNAVLIRRIAAAFDAAASR